LFGTGKSNLERVVARKDCRRAVDLKIALLDELLKNVRASAQTRFDLRHGVLAIGALHHEVSGALQQR
jgi:hypothetical protein